MKERLIDTVKSVVAVNLRYSSLLLGLSKDYLKSFEAAVREGVAGETAQEPAKPADEPPRRAQILLAGEAGETVSGAFALSNPSDRELNVVLVCQGEIEPKLLTIAPSPLVLAPGAAATVRLKLKITDAFAEGRDYAGAVVAPGLSALAVQFVVRRLPGTPAPARRKRAAA